MGALAVGRAALLGVALEADVLAAAGAPFATVVPPAPTPARCCATLVAATVVEHLSNTLWARFSNSSMEGCFVVAWGAAGTTTRPSGERRDGRDALLLPETASAAAVAAVSGVERSGECSSSGVD